MRALNEWLVIGKIFVYKLCFCYLNVQNEFLVSPANSSLVGILITIGDVTDIFTIREGIEQTFSLFYSLEINSSWNGNSRFPIK